MRLFVALLSVLAFATVTQAEDRLIYPNTAIIKYRSPGRFSALDTSLSKQATDGFRVESLAPGISSLSPSFLATAVTDAPVPLSSKTNPCRKAKVRQLLKKLSVRATCSPNYAVFADVVPNDRHYYRQYAARMMGLEQAWDVIPTSAVEQVALVVDTGVQYDHPDLQANMWKNPNEIPGNGIDDDSNGYVDDVYGINAITNTGDPRDDHYHGTHVSGIIAATSNNTIGVSGVAPNTKIIAAKFLDRFGSGSVANAIKAVTYGNKLKRSGVNIVVSNHSWSGAGSSAALLSVLKESTDLGILVVTAAGNQGLNLDTSPRYPASYKLDGLIAVAASTSSGIMASYSNYGTQTVQLSAPGSFIISTYTRSSYAEASGTSMASPMVAGVALLAKAICPQLTPKGLKDNLMASVKPYPNLTNRVTTAGLVSGINSVTLAQTSCPR